MQLNLAVFLAFLFHLARDLSLPLLVETVLKIIIPKASSVAAILYQNVNLQIVTLLPVKYRPSLRALAWSLSKNYYINYPVCI